VLNVDRTLWMLAFNNTIANLSSYSGQQSQNFYLYKDQYGQITKNDSFSVQSGSQ